MMIFNKHKSRENCGKCTKQIFVGQSAIICSKCDNIYHSNCFKDYTIFRDNIYCLLCIDQYDIIKYNPYFNNNQSDDNHDRFYETEITDYVDAFDNVSRVLEECKQYSLTELNALFVNTTTNNNPLHANNDDNSTENSEFLSHLFYNIDGNESNFDEFACSISCIGNKFSVIGIAETNTDPTNKDHYRIHDYNSCYQNKKEGKKKGTGVALYVHDNYAFTELSGNCTDNLESLFVQITNLNEPVIVGVVYRPPSGNINHFHAELSDILSELPIESTVHILGDYNIDLLSNSYHDTMEFENIVISSGYTPLISTHTHHRHDCRKTCIDNILTNDPDRAIVSGTISTDTHHKPIFQMSYINSKKMTQADQKSTILYDYSPNNISKFCDILRESSEELNVIHEFETFYEFYQNKIDQAFKLETPRITKRTSIVNPWITRGIITSIETKTTLYEDWKKSKSNDLPKGNLKKYEIYKEHRRVLGKTIKLAKKRYYGGLFDKYKMDPKKTWSVINDIRGKHKSLPKTTFVIGSERINCRRAIATKFNEYFVSLASNMNAVYQCIDIPVLNVPQFSQYLSNKVEPSIFLHDTDELEINNIIEELQNGKASDIPIILIKQSAKIISPLLTWLYNNCMRLGDFPEIFKFGKVTPIFKKGNAELFENYRPVSILPIFGKIFEKIIYKRFYSFFTSQHVLSSNQFGFRKAHSTVHALHSSVKIIEDAMNNNMHTIGIFIDLSKAFDTLDHNILLDKLEHYGIRGIAKQLTSSYLTNRRQYTCFGGEESNKLFVRFGVPQGSVLGPLLFLVYINDIVNCYKFDNSNNNNNNDDNTNFILYADDTNIFVIGKTKKEAYILANSILNDVYHYMKFNLLHINMDKCYFMHFAPNVSVDENCARSIQFASNSDICSTIYLNGIPIKEVSEIKFLGVIIDNKLNWSAHIQYLTKKLRSAAASLSIIRHLIPEEHYMKLYHALFESHLIYGISVWGGVAENKINPLFTVQKHCVRILFGDRKAYLDKYCTCARTRSLGMQKLGSKFFEKEHTKPIFNKNELLTVHNLHKYFCILETFKILKFRVPIRLHEMYSNSYCEGLLLLTPEPSIQFWYTSAKAWNSTFKKLLMGPDFDLTTKVSYFKQALKALLFSRQKIGEEHEWKSPNFLIS